MSIESSLVKLANKIDADGASNVSPEYKNPNNSVEKSLERIADNYEAGGGGGGTGGGLLKVNVNEQGQMDKTYAEIKAAFWEGIVFYIQSIPDGDVLCIVTNCFDNEGDGCCVTLQRLFGGGLEMFFECQNVNDYPVAQLFHN